MFREVKKQSIYIYVQSTRAFLLIRKAVAQLGLETNARLSISLRNLSDKKCQLERTSSHST